MSPAPEQGSSGRTDFGTPRRVVEALEAEFGPIELDVAASPELHVCEPYLTDIGGHWPRVGNAFLNPPYGRKAGVGRFLKIARLRVEQGRAQCVICLVPARPETQWWSEAVAGATWVLYLDRRIRFEGEQWGAKFPSALIIYGWPTKSTWVCRTRAYACGTISLPVGRTRNENDSIPPAVWRRWRLRGLPVHVRFLLWGTALLQALWVLLRTARRAYR